MVKRIILAMMICCLYYNAMGQQGCDHALSGRVLSATTKSALAGATVVLLPVHKSVVTNASGYFIISGLCKGDYRLSITSVGYSSLHDQQLSISTDLKDVYLLDPVNIHLDDVEVMGTQTRALSSSKHQLSSQDLQESKGKVLGDALSRIAGVSTLNTGSTIVKPVINGLHSNRILIMNNGVRQEGQQWGTEHAPEIDPFTAGTIAVIKGAEAVRYGADALGGVILTTPSPLDADKSLGGRIDLIGESNGRGGALSTALEGNVKAVAGLAWRAQASTRKLGNIKSAEYYLGNTGTEELNFSTQLQYTLKSGQLDAYFSHFGTNMGIFRGAHVGTLEDIYSIIENGKPLDTYDFDYAIAAPRQRVAHDLAKVKWEHRLQDKGTLEVQYSYQRNHRREYDLRRVESDDLPMVDLSLVTQTLDAVYRNRLFQVGVNGTLQINNNRPGTGTTPIIPNYDNHNIGVFGMTQLHRDNYHLEFGLRYDYRYFDAAGYRYDYQHPSPDGVVSQVLYTGHRSFHNVSGTAGLLMHILPGLNWRSNVGLAWRAPSANELYSDGLHHGSGIYEVGNPDMKSEKGLKWINNVAYTRDRFGLEVDVYAQYIYDYIYAVPNPDSVRQTIRGTFPIYSYEQHDAFFFGWDIKANYQLTDNWKYDLSYSSVKARNVSLDTYLPFIPSDRLSHSLQWTYGRSSAIGEQPYLKLTHRYVARQKRFNEGSDYVAPPPAYHLLDAHIGTSWKWGGQQLQATFSVENLTNRLYKDYMDTFRYYAHRMGRNVSFRLAYIF
jgi:iron complex outermembrane receptor protein